MLTLKRTVPVLVALESLGAVALLVAGCQNPPDQMPDVCASGTGTLAFQNDSGEAVQIALSDEAGELPGLNLVNGQSQNETEPVGAYSVTVTGQTSHHTLLTQSYAVRCDASTPVLIAAETPLSLSVSVMGSGTGSVSSNPAGIQCVSGSTNGCSAQFFPGSQVTLTAQAQAGSQFSGWSGGGCSGTGSCMTTISAAQTVTAQFTLQSETLTVTRSGSGHGTVTASTGALNCGSTCSASYDYGTVVTLTASAESGSEFAGWSGACSGTGDCVVTMSQAQSVTAQFNTIDYLLSVALSGQGSGTVTSEPAGLIDCGNGNTTCTSDVASGTAVTLTAAPDAHSTFAGWSGGGCSGTGTCTLPSITAATQVTAQFDLEQESLTVYAMGAASGPGSGSVTSSVGGINCASSSDTGTGTCGAALGYGTTVVLTVNPAAGSSFTWGGACSGAGTSTTCTVTISQARNATVVFSVAQVMLTLSFAGSGTGAILTNPINPSLPGGCGGGICNVQFPYMTHVTLTAEADFLFNFIRWSAGPCQGSTNANCTFDLLAPTTVTANFDHL